MTALKFVNAAICRLIAVLFIVSFVSFFSPVRLHAAAPPTADSSIEEVVVERGRLTLSVQNALLAEVLQAIGEKAGIAIEIRGDLTERITTSFTDILLEEGLRQLLRGQSFALSYAPSASDAKRTSLIAISVLARSRVNPAATAAKVSTVGEQREKLRRIQALARQKDTKAVRELSTLALSDPSPFVRSRAVSALGQLRNQETLAPLTWGVEGSIFVGAHPGVAGNQESQGRRSLLEICKRWWPMTLTPQCVGKRCACCQRFAVRRCPRCSSGP